MPSSCYRMNCLAAAVMLLAAGATSAKNLDLTPYRMASANEEAALARSAAPPSVAADAEVLVLGDDGYKSVVAGKNGFVCVVERSWAVGFNDPQFTNTKIRAPICFNSVAAKTVLAAYLERTKGVLAGQPTADLMRRAKDKQNTFAPGPGAMCYMLSKQGHLTDPDGHWHPHLMFFVANGDAASWGANKKDSPVIAATDPDDPTITYMVKVDRWSDGTRDEAAAHN